MIYFRTNWGAKEPQNLPNHRVVEFLEKKMFAEESYQDFKAQLRKEVLNGPPTERGVGEPH